MELEFKVSASKFRVALAELIAHQLADIGISIRVRSYEWGTFYNDIRSRNFQLTTMQWPSVLEPSLLRWIFHSENIPMPDNRAAGANRGAYRNDEVDRLLDAGNRETDREKRRQIYARVQEILAEEVPYVSLWHEDNIAVLRKGTKDYFVTPNARFEGLKQTKPAPKTE
jgi:peptide/nickel transport system substrate-binding protein